MKEEESPPPPPQPDHHQQQQITHQIQTLLTTIPQIQIFKSKWSLISSKLKSLLSNLTPTLPQSPLSTDLLTSLSKTLTSLTSLSTLSHSPSPPKLKTQNDLDNLISKLSSHLHDFHILSQTPTTLTPQTKESVILESKTLVTKLQIGTTTSKNSALESLLGLLQEDDKNVMITVSQGILPVLVRLLDSTSSYEIKEKTVTAISRISVIKSTRNALVSEGLSLLNNLLRVLESGSVFAKERVCICIQNCLSDSKENARAICSRGGVSSLLRICIEGTPNSQGLAAGVLRNLSFFDEVKECFVEENVVGVLLGLCDSGTVQAQENAIGCLCNLVSGDDELKVFVAREGGVESLVNFWDCAVTNGGGTLEVVVRMVSTLGSCPNVDEFLVANGFLKRIVSVLDCGVLGVRVMAANALYNLAYNSNARKELGEMGSIPLLVKMLDGKAVEEKEAALKSISMLMSYVGNRKIFRKEEKGIVCVVKLLDPLLLNLDKKYVISILSIFVDSKKCRKVMVEAGAGAFLQKLVEKDVDGAKKLLDGLGHGKLWGVFGSRH